MSSFRRYLATVQRLSAVLHHQSRLHPSQDFIRTNGTLASPLKVAPSSALETNALLTSIANLSSREIEPSHTVLLCQLNSLLKHQSSQQATWETVGVVDKLVELQECGSHEVEQLARLSLSLLGYAPPYLGRGLRILSIDGGGTRGLIPIRILKHLERMCQQPIHKLFDFVCGTSTGSILAALLCIQQLPAQECEVCYHNFSTEVFKMNNLLGISQIFLNHAFYDSKLLEKVMRQFSTSSYRLYETSLLCDVPRICFVSTVANQHVVEPYLFCNYQHHPIMADAAAHYQRMCDVQCVDAIRASTAAPGFFEEVKLGQHIFLDGGILTNNPCGVAIHEARLLWGKDTPIQTILSLGTGLYKQRCREPTTAGKTSSTSLKEKIAKVVAGATDTEAVHTILKDVYPPSVYFRFQPELSEDTPIDESKPEKLRLLCQDAERFLSENNHLLDDVVRSLMADKRPQQKIQMWLNSKWNRVYSRMQHRAK